MFKMYDIFAPEGERLLKIMADFQSITGLLHIAGAVDGTHIRLQRKSAQDYYSAQYISRHGFPSILLQGIVDSNKFFWSVVCRAAGGVHDSTHFKESTLYAQLKRGEVLARPLIELQGEIIGPYLIADSAYKARTFLVKPFRMKAGRFAREKREFDRKISKGRVKLRGEAEPSEQHDPHPNSEEPLPFAGRNAAHREMALRIRGALFRHSTLQEIGGRNIENAGMDPCMS
ncbi:hypothetical protein L7F22_004254 [Adiantum nelumboides]|nr:hypothetical protein [Adiantum nelumboides]